MMSISFKELMTVSFILFAVIDILGCVPIIVQLNRQSSGIQSGKTTIAAGLIMFAFLYLGEYILGFIGLELGSFAIAGSIILFLLAMEMVLGISIFKHGTTGSTSIIPVAFPMIAGVGTITTLLSLKATYSDLSMIVAIFVNLAIVFMVLKFVPFIEKVFGKSGLDVMRKVFGIILLAMAVQLFKQHFFA